MPKGSGVFVVFVELCAGEWTFAPDDAGDVGGELSHICVGDHSADVVAHDVDGFFDPHMYCHQLV